ncbi:MAG: VanW family protein, partial [Oscillospiraceae bacterium]|nr:VanW family protein [Oscillospiraceae bacterium]
MNQKSSQKHFVPKHAGKRNPAKVAALVIAIVLALLAGGTAAAGIWIGNLDTVYPNLSLNGTMLGGLSTEEAAAALDAAGYNSHEGEEVTVQLPLNRSLVITAEELGAVLNSEEAADAAFRYGRENGFFGNALAYVRCLLKEQDIAGEAHENLTIDENALRARVSKAVSDLEADLMSSDLHIGEDTVTVVKGASSIQLNEDQLYDMIAAAFAVRDWTPLNYNGGVSGDQTLDVDSLYETVRTEPEDAFYDPETNSVTEHVNGLDFDLDLAQKLWAEAENGDLVTIPLIVTEPEVTTESLTELLFADLLGQKSTGLGGSSSSRINNIQKAVEAIDGIILDPGEEFSYNEALGPRTAENGYQPAGAYSGGKVVTEYGGGICQVSSTL